MSPTPRFAVSKRLDEAHDCDIPVLLDNADPDAEAAGDQVEVPLTVCGEFLDLYVTMPAIHQLLEELCAELENVLPDLSDGNIQAVEGGPVVLVYGEGEDMYCSYYLVYDSQVVDSPTGSIAIPTTISDRQLVAVNRVVAMQAERTEREDTGSFDDYFASFAEAIMRRMRPDLYPNVVVDNLGD